jgi:hypothetical protein
MDTLETYQLASITFLSLDFSYWIDNLGFTTEGRLAAVLIIPSLGVPNWSVIYIINTAPSPSSALKVIVWDNLVWGNTNFEECFVALHIISVCYLSENSLE